MRRTPEQRSQVDQRFTTSHLAIYTSHTFASMLLKDSMFGWSYPYVNSRSRGRITVRTHARVLLHAN